MSESMSESATTDGTRTILLNQALRTMIEAAQTKVQIATLERDTIITTILASQAVTGPVEWNVTDAGLVISSAGSVV